jgi:hypothetical protein
MAKSQFMGELASVKGRSVPMSFLYTRRITRMVME